MFYTRFSRRALGDCSRRLATITTNTTLIKYNGKQLTRMVTSNKVAEVMGNGNGGSQVRSISTDTGVRQIWTKESTRNEKARDQESKMTPEEVTQGRKSYDHAAGPAKSPKEGQGQQGTARHAPNLKEEGIQDRTKAEVPDDKDSGPEKVKFDKMAAESAKDQGQGTSRNPSRSMSTVAHFDRANDARSPHEGTTQEIKEAKDKLKSKVNEMGRSMEDIKGTVREGVKQTTDRLNNAWEDEVKGNLHHPTDEVKGTLKQASDRVSGGWEQTKAKASGIVEEVTEKAKEGWEKTKEMASAAAEKTQGVAETAKERISQGLQGMKASAEETAHSARETLNHASQRAFHQGKQVEEKVKEDWESVKGTTGYAANKVAETARVEGEAVRDSTEGVIETAKEKVKNVGASVKEAAKSTVKGALGGVSNQVRGVQDDVREGVNVTAEKAKHAAGMVKKGSIPPEELEKPNAEDVQAEISRKKNVFYSEGEPGPGKSPRDPAKKAARKQLATEPGDHADKNRKVHVKSKL